MKNSCLAAAALALPFGMMACNPVNSVGSELDSATSAAAQKQVALNVTGMT